MGINLYIMTLSGITSRFKYQKLIAQIGYYNALICDESDMPKECVAAITNNTLKDFFKHDVSSDIIEMVVCCN